MGVFHSLDRIGLVTMLATLAWLAPAPIYFALFRFDITPAVATLMSLFAIRRTAYIEGAVWLGMAIALKGYALFLLPAYCVFMVYQRGFAAAIKVGALALAPMIFSLLATLTFAGWEGMVAPFEFHALRTLNGELTFDAINYLFGAPLIARGSEARWVGCPCRSVALLLQPPCVRGVSRIWSTPSSSRFSGLCRFPFLFATVRAVDTAAGLLFGFANHADVGDLSFLAELPLFPDQLSTGASWPV